MSAVPHYVLMDNHTLRGYSRLLTSFGGLGFLRLAIYTIGLKLRNRGLSEQAYLDHLAEYFSLSTDPAFGPLEDSWKVVRSRMVQAAEPIPGETILDLATGIGYQAAEFAKNGFPVVGMDYILNRVELARAKHSSSRIMWAATDASRLPVKQDTFDVVTISLALHDMPQRIVKAVLAECRRVARRRVVIVEPRLPRNFLLRHLYGWVVLLDESAYICEFLRSDMEASLRDAGYQSVVWEHHCCGILAIYVCDV